MVHEKAKPYEKNPKWRYEDARGQIHIGHIMRTSDFGGTDCPYTFIDRETGEVNVIGGSLLKKASRIWDAS